MSFDLYESLDDLKKGQEKIMILLDGLDSKNVNKKIYDLADLIDILHVSRRTIASWTKDGSLPHSKYGNKIWVSEKQLELFLEKNGNNSSENKLFVRKGGKG